jgi:hypothetical protein
MGTFAGWTYAYTLVYSDGAETAPSPISNSVSTNSTSQQIQLTWSLPSGVPSDVTVRIFRKRNQSYYLLTTVQSSTTSIVDNAAENVNAEVLPQAQNRVGFVSTIPFGSCTVAPPWTCGYADFLPGTNVFNFAGSPPPPPAPSSSETVPNALTASANTTPSNRGWLVDVAGPVKFPAGDWTFEVKMKSGPIGSGDARLVVGMWKVKVSSGAVSTWELLIDPNDPLSRDNVNLRLTSAVQTITHAVSHSPVSLDADEYLYVQFWRQQLTPYTSAANAEARTITLYANDGFGKLTHPLADDAAPNPFSITSPSNGFVKNGYSLQSNPSDPTPGSGLASVDYFYCLPLDDCTFAASRISIGSSAASPYAVTWSGQPADGAYQLVATATDGVDNKTETAVVPITVDNTPPDTTLTSTPSDPSNGSPTFSFSSGEPGTFECSLDGAAFAACPSPDALSGLSSGSHTFQVRAVDRPANVDATPASYTWTVDATAPSATFSSTPSDPSSSAAASFSFGASEPGAFDCRLDGAPYAACTSPRSLSGLADGSHTYEVRATDGVGNTGSATFTWTVDTKSPVVSFGSTPVNPTNSPAASLAFSSNEPATLECRLDGGAYAACSSPDSVTGLADGSHTFDVRATDAVGHVGTGSFTWTVDTVAPSTPALETPTTATPTRSLRLSAVYTGPEAGSSGYVEFRVCTDAACTNVVASGPSEQVSKGATAAWAINVALADGTYFWQARSVDRAGNASGWSNVWNFTRDTKSPAAPDGFTGVVALDGLTLRWSAPPGGDQIGNYVVYVNGKQWRVLGEVTYEAKLGAFDAGDTRSFNVSAIDRAGNEGPQTTALVGVPDLVGLSLAAAKDAVETRGLVLDDDRTVSAEVSPALVVAQTPPAPALAPRGSEVAVVLGSGPTTPSRPLVEIDSGRVCGVGGFLRLQVRLRERANVNVSVFNTRSKRLALRRLGTHPPGLTNHNLHLPKALGRPGRYRVVVTAKASQRSGRDTMSITVKRPSRRSGARTGC